MNLLFMRILSKRLKSISSIKLTSKFLLFIYYTNIQYQKKIIYAKKKDCLTINNKKVYSFNIDFI